DGTVFVADNENQRVRKITPDGRISTVAGTGSQDFSGDGGPSTSAQLGFPIAVAYDGKNLYIADASNYRVRVVNAAGIISTYAGNGKVGANAPVGVAATEVALNQLAA